MNTALVPGSGTNSSSAYSGALLTAIEVWCINGIPLSRGEATRFLIKEHTTCHCPSSYLMKVRSKGINRHTTLLPPSPASTTTGCVAGVVQWQDDSFPRGMSRVAMIAFADFLLIGQ